MHPHVHKQSIINMVVNGLIYFRPTSAFRLEARFGADSLQRIVSLIVIRATNEAYKIYGSHLNLYLELKWCGYGL